MTNRIDRIVGQKIRQLRWKRGTTQAQLAQAIQVTNEELMQFELGISRLPAQCLWRVAGFFDVPVTDFFDLDSIDASASLNLESVFQHIMSDPEAAELVRSYYSLSADHRRVMFQKSKDRPEN